MHSLHMQSHSAQHHTYRNHILVSQTLSYQGYITPFFRYVYSASLLKMLSLMFLCSSCLRLYHVPAWVTLGLCVVKLLMCRQRHFYLGAFLQPSYLPAGTIPRGVCQHLCRMLFSCLHFTYVIACPSSWYLYFFGVYSKYLCYRLGKLFVLLRFSGIFEKVVLSLALVLGLIWSGFIIILSGSGQRN